MKGREGEINLDVRPRQQRGEMSGVIAHRWGNARAKNSHFQTRKTGKTKHEG